MGSRLKDIQFGSVNIHDFAYWINERNTIYLRKATGDKKPWTEDEIFQNYKFTNAYRQLDKGTVALKDMLTGNKFPAGMTQHEADSLLFFNIVWYRLFNWYEHAKELGFVYKFVDLENYIRNRYKTNKKIFTGAHMTTGIAFEDKHETYLRAAVEAWNRRTEFTKFIKNSDLMENVFEKLLDLYMVGRFVSYEITCDLRFTTLLINATDKLTWANLGPGAQRGLKRLGLPYENQQQGLTSMRLLYERLLGQLMDEDMLLDEAVINGMMTNNAIPFELREVEHSLCEFDKYCRVQFGEGRPRAKYNGRAE